MGDAETILRTGVHVSGEYRLLVAVSNPDTVEQLMRTARDLARLEGGSVHVVSVVEQPYESPFRLFDDETIRREFAGDRREILDRAVAAGDEAGVDVTGTVVVARRAVNGILETVDAVGADALLVGWRPPRGPTDAVLGTTIDSLVERAPCDVLVERVGKTADGVESVLSPVVEGPHAALAARVGYAIATANDARVVVASVADGGTGRSTARENVAAVERELAAIATDALGEAGADDGLPSAPAVEGLVLEADDVVGALVAEADRHDVVVMGATRGGALRRRLVGSIPQAVASRTDRTALLARRWTEPSRPVRLLGRLRRS